MRTVSEDTTFGTSLGLAFLGGYARCCKLINCPGHTVDISTGNCVLAAVSFGTFDGLSAWIGVLAVLLF